MVIDNPVINEPSYLNLFYCGKNLLNKLNAMYRQACMLPSRGRYYTETFKTLTDYNDLNNTPLSNTNIQEAIRKFIEEVSVLDTNNVTEDTFSHMSNTQRENVNAIFTSEKLDKLDELVDAVKRLTINDAKYYELNTATVSDSQSDLTCNPDTFTHTNNGKQLLALPTVILDKNY